MMDLTTLKKINNENIKAAGARYSPIIDPGAPNLEIKPLVNSIEALALSARYRDLISDLEIDLTSTWKGISKEITSLFSSTSPINLIHLLQKLRTQKPGKSEITTKLIVKIIEKIIFIIQKESTKFYETERKLTEHSEDWRAIQSLINDIRKLGSSIQKVKAFTYTPGFKLILKNRMFLLGEWGSGKTHLLCDITKERMHRDLPTLFFLAHRLPSQSNPLKAICQSVDSSLSPNKLLNSLNELGKSSDTRCLLIIDGINEADRKAWKEHISHIILKIKKYKNIGLILSCRTPFDKQILVKTTRSQFVQVFHTGFQEIELDAQKSFFKFYNIPDSHIPLLTPEFSRPLFLKIICLTFSGQTSSTKSKWISDIASGQKTMTKLFEDFIVLIGSKIESDFGLESKTCWRILKGYKKSTEKIGVAISMANSVRDYVDPKECVKIIKEVTQKTQIISNSIFKRLITEGLLAEDIIWENSVQKHIIRFPYQRFSDHLIVRHLLSEYLNTTSEKTIRRSFYKNKPLGKVFEIEQYGHSYKMPGIASAIMLEFPERVKNTLPHSERELVYYLPKTKRLLLPLIDSFLEGVLWRSKDSFTDQTNHIFRTFLLKGDIMTQRRTLETLVSLACRTNHPYSAERLYTYLSAQKVVDRDLLWSEFIRNSNQDSAIYRLLTWIETSLTNITNLDTIKNLTFLLSLFLTSTDRDFRNKVTKALVLLGEKEPKVLFNHTLESLAFNDPYVPERMLAASYGLLMRNWAFPSQKLKDSVVLFSDRLYDMMFKKKAPYSTNHVLFCDYAIGILELSQRINKQSLRGRLLRNLKRPFESVLKIPDPKKIKEGDIKGADSAIHLDFGNYTIGHLIQNRRNYDYQNKEYQSVLKQIKWRILNLGYSTEVFKNIDSRISSRSYSRQDRDGDGKIDRYGKKYSWIAFFEVAGKRLNKATLPKYHESRISDCDVDPSFPKAVKTWQPELNVLFEDTYTSPEKWTNKGISPNYSHIIELDEVDNIKGSWVLLGGFISESSNKDPRKVFTFLNGVFTAPLNISRLEKIFNSKEYPGNHQIPEAGQDYYTFTGEIPWSKKYGFEYFKDKKTKRHIAEAFTDHQTFIVRKRTSTLTESDKFSFALQNMRDEELEFPESVKKAQDDIKNLPKFIEVSKHRRIPGIKVEVPTHRLSSKNNPSAADFLAPALCDFLNLRNKSDDQDLYDTNGNLASIYRIFKTDDSGSNLFYIRKDLLIKYLEYTNQELILFIWGERSLSHEELEKTRSEGKDLWSSHDYIHKTLKIIKPK